MAVQKKFSKLIVLSGILLSNFSIAEPIYKATLPDGRVIYTDNIDNAYKQVTNNSQITILDNLDNKVATTTTAILPTTIPMISTSSPVSASVSPPLTSINTKDTTDALVLMNISATEASRQGDYRLIIQSPENEMAYHRPAQQIDVQISLTPQIKQGDRLVYEIDGQAIGHSAEPSFSFPSVELNPGKHTLAVKITNTQGTTIGDTSTNFYVILSNPLIKKQKKLIAERASYDALPWYTKVGKHLKGEEAPIDPKNTDMKHLDIKK